MKNITYLCSIILIMLLMIPSRTYSQSQNENHIMTETMLDASGKRSVKSVQYYDGLGRPNVLAAGGLNTSGKYVYSMTEYDMLGRESKAWQPAVGGTAPDIITASDIAGFSKTSYSDSHAYNTMEYDALGRPTFKSTSGDKWDGKGIKTEYITNDNSNHKVRKYSLDKNGNPNYKEDAYYQPCSLTGTKTTDEDGHTIEVYKDLLDNVVLERRDGNNDTYYIYDRGLLKTVIPPLYQTLKSSTLLYKYEYDGHGRCKKKTLPGNVIINYWYDKYGRMAFMQDGRMKAEKKYRFFLYDGLSRMVVQGMCTGGANTIDSTYSAKVVFGNGANHIDNSGYYTESGYILTSPSVEIVNYYDGYGHINLNSFKDVASTWNLKSNSDVCTTTLLTGQMVTDNNGKRYYRVMYYDEKGRCTEMKSTSVDDYFINTNTNYSFTDKITKNITKIYRNSLSRLQQTVMDSIEYDSICDLPVKEYIQLDNNSMELVSENIYDDLGRLVECKSNNGNISDSYKYNLHGWLTNHQNYDYRLHYAPLFSEKLYYADGPNPDKCYNGNISAQVYTDANDQWNEKGYMFRYDGMDRLSKAKFMEGLNLDINPRVSYTEEISYNANSAITSMKRYGDESRYGYVDDLVFNYTGNRLYTVDDNAFDINLGENRGFYDGIRYYGEYNYDACGSLIKDDNKGIRNIWYDFNGMPTGILFADGSITEYVYTADGVKLKTIHRTAVDGLDIPSYGSYSLDLADNKTLSVDSTLYVGSLEVNGRQSKYYFSKGYIHMEDGHLDGYYYLATDHLGNIRHVDKVAPDNRGHEIVQVNNYYPYGSIHAEGNRGQEVQTHKYNGKEFDTMHGLNLYDYSARQYDPAIGQFTSMDPLCEKYYHISPYVYCAGNPVKYVDPDGDTIRVSSDYQQQFNDCMNDAFGPASSELFSFDTNGNLQISKGVKKLSKDQKKLLNGLMKINKATAITNVVFGDSYQNEGVNFTATDLTKNGGALIALASENYSIKENYVVVNPNAPSSLPTDIVTADYYRLDGNPGYAKEGDVLFKKGTFLTNTTDRLFHEFGHIINNNKRQSFVINYNNYVRKIIGLPIRQYDSTHNILIR